MTAKSVLMRPQGLRAPNCPPCYATECCVTDDSQFSLSNYESLIPIKNKLVAKQHGPQSVFIKRTGQIDKITEKCLGW